MTSRSRRSATAPLTHGPLRGKLPHSMSQLQARLGGLRLRYVVGVLVVLLPERHSCEEVLWLLIDPVILRL